MVSEFYPVWEWFETVSLEEINRQSSYLKRIEKKYLTESADLHRILWVFLPQYRILEIEDKNIFAYSSIYFDTKDLLYYHQHHQGKRRRKKIRTRMYQDSLQCFLEIKLKSKRETIKKRIPVASSQHGVFDETALEFVLKQQQKIYKHTFAESVSPRLEVRYKRITLANNDFSERLTFDFDFDFIDYQTKSCVSHQDMLIIESKAQSETTQSKSILKSLGVKQIDSCSKYCIWVNLLWLSHKKNRFLPTLKRVRSCEG